VNKFEPATLNLPSRDAFIKRLVREHGITMKAARVQYRLLKRDEVWVNDTYQVNIDRLTYPEFIHVSIKRLDKGHAKDWRDFQQIKNELIGPEFEAVELYPAESRLIDTVNQFHLWVLKGERPIEVGWFAGRTVEDEAKGNTVQRPREKET
jgi:hypothetical protein